MQGGFGVVIGVAVVPSTPMLRVNNTVWLLALQGEAGVELGIAPVALMSMPMPRMTFVTREFGSPVEIVLARSLRLWSEGMMRIVGSAPF